MDFNNISKLTDREFLLFQLKKEWPGYVLFSIVFFGAPLLIIFTEPFFPHQDKLIIITYPIIFFNYIIKAIFVVKCAIDYLLKKETKEEIIIPRRCIKRHIYWSATQAESKLLFHYLSKTSKNKWKDFVIDFDRILFDEEKAKKHMEIIDGKETYVADSPIITVCEQYKIRYYPISKLVVCAEQIS